MMYRCLRPDYFPMLICVYVYIHVIYIYIIIMIYIYILIMFGCYFTKMLPELAMCYQQLRYIFWQHLGMGQH